MPGPFVLSWSPARTRGRSAPAASAIWGSAASLNRPIAFDGGYHSSCLEARNVRLGSWPSKNALPREVGEKPGPVRSQAANRGHQQLGTNDVHDPCQIIGEDRESHLGGYFW